MPGRQRSRVILVDDHALVREGLCELLRREPDLTVVGEAADRDEALALLRSSKPDIALVDLSLSGEMAFSLVTAMKEVAPSTKILVVSMLDENIFAELALSSGASGYISKCQSSASIVQAMRRVLAGHTHVSEAVADKVLSKLARASRNVAPRSSPVALLSEREIEILRGIGLGRGTREIAADLRISAKTVETHRTRIKEKLQVRTANELVVMAANWLRDGFLDVSR